MDDILKKYSKDIDRIIEMALHEDVGSGDITTGMLVPENAEFKGSFVAKSDGIVCGLPLAKKVFEKLDKNIKVTFRKKDGQEFKSGEILAVVRGNARAILTGERLSLNLVQRLSGVATETKKFVDIVKPYKVTILDTRKTTPNLRVLEKYAVRMGGATNHRMGLYDAILIKDNHHAFIEFDKAVYDLRRWLPKNIKIEIEVFNTDDLEKAIRAKPDIIMLDNMNLSLIEECVARVRKEAPSIKIEVSGGVNLQNVREIARKRPDYISVGSITHSPKALDISFRIEKK